MPKRLEFAAANLDIFRRFLPMIKSAVFMELKIFANSIRAVNGRRCQLGVRLDLIS